jgi:hypothetical protein
MRVASRRTVRRRCERTGQLDLPVAVSLPGQFPTYHCDRSPPPFLITASATLATPQRVDVGADQTLPRAEDRPRIE